jgi:hypothetical protein
MAKKQITNFKFVPGAIPPAYGQYPKTSALIKANEAFLIAEVDAYIRQQVAANVSTPASPYYGYTYTPTRSTKCQRDAQYLIDALAYDLDYGGNSATYRMIARCYNAGILQLQNPLIEVDVYTWLRGKVTTNILTNTTYTRLNSTQTQVIITGASAETAGVTQVTALWNSVITAIQAGVVTALPTPVLPDSQMGGLLPNALALLQANKRFIQEETIAYIAYNVANNISPFVYFTYDSEKCRRDVSYILEGYITDLSHGGNRQTVNNAAKYFENGIPQVDGNRQPETAAHTFIQSLVINYVLANVPYTSKQTTVSQTVNNAIVTEAYAYTMFTDLSNTIIDVITNGVSYLPTAISNRAYVKFPGFYKLKDILLVTNTSRNTILYNFADPTTSADLTYSESYDSDFPASQYGQEKITTLVFNTSTTGMMVTDQIQIFVEGKEQVVKMNSIASDAMERMKVGIPQSMLDADFEYGLQPTKWQTISMMRNYPSVYEIPGSDTPVVSVTTDASSGTSNIGASLITVTTTNPHGLSVNNVFTIKALAASIKGFNRAEGTFLVSSVPTSTTFTYYAKSRVGTSNGQQLSSGYTQLRKAGYYTGASVGTPSFNVYSNGQSGTITTQLFTASGSNVIGFAAPAPVVGSPLSGTGINTGTQITSVVGSGGTVTATQLTSTANIGDTSLIVSSIASISPGLVVDRGDGTSVAVSSINGNTVSLSGALTSKILGTNQTYTNLSGTTNGNGVNATFNISRTALGYNVAIGNNNGNSYLVGDTITILGTSLDGSTTANDAIVTVTGANPINSVATLGSSISQGSGGYASATNVATAAQTGVGTGLTVTTTVENGFITDVSVYSAGSGYQPGDIISINGGSANDALIVVGTVNAGGDILSVSVSGTPVTAPTVSFISGFTMNDITTQTISASSSISYTSIATIQITFQSAHGFVPGDGITVQITSTDTNAQLAAGAFFVEQVPTATTLLYTARAQGTIANTLTGQVFSRPDSFYIHRPYDGGVQLGTGGPAHGATAIRMSKKYIRYQSGKGVMYNTGALFAPSYDIAAITAAGTAIGSSITITTDDTDHGCQVGAVVKINGVTTSGFNGVYTVVSIIDERNFTVQAQQVLGSTTVVLGDPCYMSVYQWHGSSVRSGTFDDQNGMFWQYDGIRMSVGRRSSTNHLAGTISIAANSNTITGTGTRFSQQLAVGDRIVIKGMSHVVSSITDDANMTVTPDYRGVNNVVNGKATKTIDYIVPQEQWNLDPCNGTGPSGYNIDVTKMQMIGMQWTWYGAGFIDFMLRGPAGDYVFVHRFRNSNVNPEAYMRSGNQPVRYEVINESAKGRLSANITSSQTTIPLRTNNTTVGGATAPNDAYWFPNSGTVSIDGELIRFTGNDGVNLTGCVRAATLNQFVSGANRTYSGSVAAAHNSGAGVILVSNTVTPIISHWGSAFMIDGQFDSDRGYIFNYAATGVTATLTRTTAFLMRLAPSVSNAQVGDLGDKELLNRAQLLLSSIDITSDSVSGSGGIVIEGILNPSNYPTDPTLITWTGLSNAAAGGQPSFVQVASGGSVSWGGNATTSTATVQGAFTTTLTAKSFAPITTNLTAKSFSAVTQTLSAASFASATSTTYNSAFSTTRNDFLIATSAYDALTTPIAVGDTLSATTYVTGGQTVTSVTRAYITLASVSYTRIVMSSVANSTSPAASSNGNQNISTTLTSSVAATYASAISTARSDFLITQTQYNSVISSIKVTDALSAATYITGSQSISSITPNYTTIAGTVYARVVMTGVGNASSTTGNGNDVTVTDTNSYTVTYGSALSTARSDFLVTDAQWAASGVAAGDVLSLSTYITGNQTISSVTTGYVTLSGTSYTRVVMSGVANATSTSGGSNDQTVTVTAVGSAASYQGTNYLFFTSASWTASGATVGTPLATSVTSFPAGTSVSAISSRTFGATTVYRVSFTQSANTTISAAATITFQFGAAYALPGEQVFSFIAPPGTLSNLDLSALKELTSTAIGGRGTFPNGPDVLAINVYKTAGSNTTANVIIRWSEAQA